METTKKPTTEKKAEQKFPLPSAQSQIDKLTSDLAALNAEIYNNNFSAHQEFNKYSNFTSRIKVPHYASLPATCEVGELVESDGVLKICSATNTWTTVGTQT